jgi:hypothetical protein
MIGEVIKKKGEKGSGGGKDAFVPGVHYICGKATRVELRNLSSSDWLNAGLEMLLTSELSPRVQKPYYHVVLSWHALEHPTEDQMVEAMDHLIRALGLDEHQVAMGTHPDTWQGHIHAAINRVHPTTGKTWSKSNDQQKIELACRELEVAQGWSHDRGRFDFEVKEVNGVATVSLLPNDDVWAKKKQERAEGARQPSAGDIAFQKHNGVPSFNQDIPTALKKRFAQAAARAKDWDSFHRALVPLGLTYQRHGSGARIYLNGSEEFAKASAFGQAFSINTLQKQFGAYKAPPSNPTRDPRPIHVEVAAIAETTFKDDGPTTKSAGFKLTLLRRVYTGLHLDEDIVSQIRFVDVSGKPPQVTFDDNSSIVDHGTKISASAVTEATIKATVAMAKAKGWSGLVASGSPAYVRGIALEAAKAGIRARGVPEEVQILVDEILEKARKRANRLAREADLVLQGQPAPVISGEDNGSEVARKAADAIFGNAQPKPTDEPVYPQLRAPDAIAKPITKSISHDRGGKPQPQVQLQIRGNTSDELDDMKRVDIGVIADLGGWLDVSRSHADSSDPLGKRYRIFTRGGDTLKCSQVDGKWLWTSNKSGTSGSAIDLWLQDNPGKSIGHARQAFREILGTAQRPTPASIPQRVPEREDHTEARRRWMAAPQLSATSYSYAEERGISRSTLERFPNEVRSGAFGGIYFAHRNTETGDILGFEQRWEKDGQKNAARFAKGGRKTVNVLGNSATAIRMVVVEGGLDALALAELEVRNDTIYVSTGGGFGPLTEVALQRLAIGKAVVSAFDNDEAGAAMHEKLRGLISGAERYAPPCEINGSEAFCKDWLDVLKAERSVEVAVQQQDPVSSDLEAIPMPAPTVIDVDKDAPSGQPDMLGF